MITNTFPGDYERLPIITDEHVKVCPLDGGRFACCPSSPFVAVCLICHGSDYEMILESECAAFRETLSQKESPCKIV